MTFIAVQCPHCQSEQIVKRGKTRRGNPTLPLSEHRCAKGSFLLDYCNRGCLPEVKQTIIDMSLNASGIRDTARSLRICPNTVLSELKKKEALLESVNTAMLRTLTPVKLPWTWTALVKLRWMRCGLLSAIKATPLAVACHRSSHRQGLGLCFWSPQR